VEVNKTSPLCGLVAFSLDSGSALVIVSLWAASGAC